MLRTERLLLRRARATDLNAIHAILSDRRAMRYWSSLPHQTLAESDAWLANMIAAPVDKSDDFIVEHEGRTIGKTGCWRLPEIGFIFHPEFWGRGFASEAMTAAIAHLFAAHPLPALKADVDPRNAASLGLLRRLGFVETHRAKATWTIGEEVCDSVYLELARP